MRNHKCILGRILSGAVAAAAVGLLAGCFSANVDVNPKPYTDLGKSYADTYAGRGSDEDRAVHSAREAAIDAGIPKRELDEYAVGTSRRDQFWWVEFRHTERAGKSWPDRFVVRVDADGKTRLYKNPADAPR